MPYVGVFYGGLKTSTAASNYLTMGKKLLRCVRNFNPLLWHFCSIQNMRKLEKKYKNALYDFSYMIQSDYNMLLSISDFETLHLKRMFALEVFTCLYDFNPCFMSSTFNIKNVPYNFRDNTILTIPNFKSISYSKRSFKYYGAHVWNHIPVKIKAANNIKTFQKTRCRCNLCKTLWSLY